jgi:hypothetical protein
MISPLKLSSSGPISTIDYGWRANQTVQSEIANGPWSPKVIGRGQGAAAAARASESGLVSGIP